ncbi:leucyl aminopeptidase family protein [Actinomycetospora termitidis]|uniref:Probable cytosol aminopeptidase n=1 Tax=Actinomycetospora termitidis TaxID=3053470 RepID=A0ABT7M9J3_9PSEU|nr:leucyl aminopeptidase family protein [Actinomycetospora sp. Odt1-22]MDL5157344.1 leucyl aminopeptidase family protein [Actinomycetospora sp. Odt1-22]
MSAAPETFAAPTLPTPVAGVRAVDPGAGPDGAAAVRLCRTGEDVPAPADAPSGWIASAGAVAALSPDGSAGPGRWLVGVGAGSAKDWRAAGAAAVRVATGRAEPGPLFGAAEDGPARLHVAPDEAAEPDWAALATGLLLGSHRFSVRSAAPAAPPEVTVEAPAADRPAFERALVLARATAVARDLADTPSGAKSPAWFAEQAVAACAGLDGLTTVVRDEAWLVEQGFGGVLAVGGGSSRPPRFLEISWDPPSGTAGAPVVLVGKGITFDTGGISIKPNAGMADMRTDCSGGAAVVGALATIARLGLGVRVVGLVPLAENHVSGSAYRPGDVVRHYDGRTTEVTNTDAEGRMVLADALGYAVETLAPAVVVDVATLTGAMKVALGVRTGGLFATTDDLAVDLTTAGAATGEAWWRVPLAAEHDGDVDSRLADVRQAPPGPGGIVAALFLHRFVGDVPWAHLDIAGPARCDSPHEEVAKGATGFAARTLVEFVAARTPAP